MSVALHWFRRDLRITDNTALSAALAAHGQVIPIYVRSNWDKHHRWCGAARQEFLCGCLTSLAKNLQAKGGRLVIRHGDADVILTELARETGAEAIYFNRDPDPFGRVMERRLKSAAKRLSIRVHACKDIALHERDELLTSSGSPFRIFTPYAKAWLKLEKPAPARAVSSLSTPANIRSDPLPTLESWGLESDGAIIQPGENAARKRLDRFLDGPIFRYADTRNLPGCESTSRLSQDLRHGTLSIREVYAKCAKMAERGPAQHQRSVGIFINELIWREFYMQVLWHFPQVLEREFQEDYRTLTWRDYFCPGEHTSSEAFKRWCRGETGFPIVDAGMRQLTATGFMHNRVRMITAMFLTKDLHIWWMHGESWFMQRLVDGEIASNNGGWQWSASTGTDAAPYFRIQNPWSQTKRYDPDGEYIKRWVRELRHVPAACFQAPPEHGSSLADSYPPPMIDHAKEREIALEMFRR